LVNLIEKNRLKEENPGLDLLRPRNGTEKTHWIAVNVIAASCEEIIFRGVLFAIFYGTSHNAVLAGIMSAVCFGFSHSIQGYTAIALTIVFGLGLQYLAWTSKGLLLPAIVHFTYNMGTTFLFMEKEEDGDQDQESPPSL
jgi:membrane protease YdiL (CAAX protease family)